MSIDVRRAKDLSDRVAAEIRAEMARRRISGRTLARTLGKSPNWVSLKTSGAQRLDLEDLELIAHALGVTVVDLFPPRDRQVTVTYLNGSRIQRRPPDRRPPNRPGGPRSLTGPNRSPTARLSRAA